MNKATNSKYSNIDQPVPPRFITQDEAKKMSKYRVIQKNLVHVQGFPDSVLNCLESFEFFGQFGKIIKLVIVKGKDEDNQPSQIKKSNSAYITFSTNEEAAHAVLSVDSFYYENHLIRAFFGTSKYCIHFLNNKECYNKDKCMYLHALASETHVLGNTCGIYSKFDYSEHLQIALSISGVLTKEKREKIFKLKLASSTVFPNIKSIYTKDIVLQAEKSRLDLSSPTFTSLSTRNNSSKESERTSTNDEDASTKSSGKCSENSDQEYSLYHYRAQSRFFNGNNCSNGSDHAILVPFYLIDLVDKTLSRYSFFNKLSESTNNNRNECISLLKQQDHILYDSWSDFINSNNN